MVIFKKKFALCIYREYAKQRKKVLQLRISRLILYQDKIAFCYKYVWWNELITISLHSPFKVMFLSACFLFLSHSKYLNLFRKIRHNNLIVHQEVDKNILAKFRVVWRKYIISKYAKVFWTYSEISRKESEHSRRKLLLTIQDGLVNAKNHFTLQSL